MQYFKGKDHCFATNSKVMKQAICYGIVKKDWPEKLEELQDPHFLTYYTMIEQTDAPEKPVLMLMRDPVERFLSACAMNNTTVDDAIAVMQEGHPLFDKQSDYVTPDTTIFRYPDQIKEFCDAAGFAPLPVLNQSEYPKPKLTKKQKAAVEAYYADDISLWESLGG